MPASVVDREVVEHQNVFLVFVWVQVVSQMQGVIADFQNEVFSAADACRCENLTEGFAGAEHELQRAEIVVSVEGQFQSHKRALLE